MNDDLTLLSIGGATKHIKSIEKSISDYMLYNNQNVIAVNVQQLPEYQNLCQNLNIITYTPNKKYKNPIFTKDEINDLIDWIYNIFVKPCAIIDTNYFILAEPDSMFFKTIDNSYNKNNIDIYCPDNLTDLKVTWLFFNTFMKLGENDTIRLENFRKFYSDLNDVCKKINIDLDAAAKNDMRTCFGANSIVKTKKIHETFIDRKKDVVYLIQQIINLTEKYKPSNHLLYYNNQQSLLYYETWEIISIICGIFSFSWKVNPNCISTLPEIKTQQNLQNLLTKYPNLESLHSCKIYYDN